MGNLEKALKYPFADKVWGPKFVLGGILNAVGMALVYPVHRIYFRPALFLFPLGVFL